MSREIYDADDIRKVSKTNRLSPADKAIAELDGRFKKLTTVAEELGVHPETLRRLTKSDRVKAPSKALLLGKMTIYLFTPEDEEELRQYFKGDRETFLRSAK